MNKYTSYILAGVAILMIGFFASQSGGPLTNLSTKSNLAAISGAGSGLVAHYTFDGNANDVVGGNHGTPVGSPTYVTGRIGEAIRFNGVSDSVSLGDFTGVEGLQGLTISLWIKSNVTENVSGSDTFIQKEGSGADTFYMNWSQSEDIDFCVVGISGVSCPGTGTAIGRFVDGIPTGSGQSWHHVVGVYDGSAGQVKVYVNGIAGGVIGSLSGSTQNSVHPFVIGSSWNGFIDDLRIYSRSLTSSEISELYALGGGVPNSNPTTPPPQPPTPDPSVTPPPPTPPTNTNSNLNVVRTTAPSPISWTPPIGIPDPVASFGGFDPIRGTHFMYQLGTNETCTSHPNKCFNFTDGRGVTPYPDNGSGPYTHYVDNTHPSATDTNNPFGTHLKPRRSVPGNVPAGSVVEVRGGPYTQLSDIVSNGESDKVIFYRGHDNSNKVSFRDSPFKIRGRFIVVENIAFLNARPDIRPQNLQETVRNVVIRNSNVRGFGYGGSTNGYRTGTPPVENSTSNVVFFNLDIQMRDVEAMHLAPDTDENDTMGIAVASLSKDVWILNNTVSGVGGDCFGTGHAAGYTAINYYIGFNRCSNTGENGVDLKEVDGAVVSQNVFSDFKGPSSGSTGDVLTVHYGPQLSPKNAWFLYNEIYDATDAGIKAGGDQVHDVYFIGNIVRDIHNSRGDAWAYKTWSSRNVYLVNNVFHNVDNGIYSQVSGVGSKLYLANNIISNVRTNGYHLTLEGSSRRSALDSPDISNNIFFQPGHSAKFSINGVSNSIVNTGPDKNLTQFMTEMRTCANCIEIDPKFVNVASNDFRLQSTSPAINAGSETLMNELETRFKNRFGSNLSIKYDFLTNPRPVGAYDIGAFEYGATGGNNTYTPPTPNNPNPPTPSAPTDTDSDGIIDSLDLCQNTPTSYRTSVNRHGCIRPRITNFDIRPDSEQDIRTVSNLRFGRTGIGEVRFDEQVTLVRNSEPIDVDSGLSIALKKISLNAVTLPELNKRATITLYGITETNPKILRDGSPCSDCIIRSFANGTISFSVFGFSTYEVTEGDSAPVIVTPPVPAPSSGGGSYTTTYGSGFLTPTQNTCSPGALFDTTTGARCATVSSAGLTGNSIVSTYTFTKTLRLGMRDGEVKSLQQYLNTNGYTVSTTGLGSSGNESTYFGPATRAALIRYQAAKGLTADGIFGPRTRAVIQGSAPVVSQNTTPTTQTSSGVSLRLNSSGPAVKALRQKLRSLGYFSPYGSPNTPSSEVNETSFFGATTEAALKKYQCDKNIVCSGSAATTGWGVVGQRTRAELGL